MKKVLVTVAALGLVAGVATTASAVEWKMSGKYKVEGAYLSDARTGGLDVTEAAGDSTPSDAYYLHTFETNVDMKVNDKITMNTLVRLADDDFWGTQGDIGTTGSGVGPTTGDVYVKHLAMMYASPIGKIQVGRVLSGPYGTDFMNKDSRADRIRIEPSFLASGPWSTMFYMDKVKDNDVVAGANTDQSNADSDTYVARLYYKTDATDAGIHYGYTNDKTDTGNDDNQKQQITAYGKFKLDNYFANAELTDFFGSKSASVDYDSWAGMLQVGGKFGNLTVSGMYFYAQGQDLNDIATEDNAALGSTGTGDLFEPLYMLTGRHTGLLNNDVFAGDLTGASATSSNLTDMSKAGVHAFVLAADYKASDALTLHGAIGYAKADEKIYQNGAATYDATLDDDYGWEYNIGAAYKLLDNLTYEAHFGYLDTGDYFNRANPTDITNNVYMMSHSLTMTF